MFFYVLNTQLLQNDYYCYKSGVITFMLAKNFEYT